MSPLSCRKWSDHEDEVCPPFVSCRFLGLVSTVGGKRQRVDKKVRPGVGVELTDIGPGDDLPRELPIDLWSSCLQSLYLQSNNVKWLPDYIGNFSGLARLDVSR